MSASAGRILVIHKGDYNATATYSPMDEVFYQGSTYRCIATSTGNAPTNTAYWQLVARKGENADAENVAFDKTGTNLTSDNLQDVVVEVNEKVDNVDEKADTKAFVDLLKDTVGWTGKNLLKNTANTQVKSGVTYTVHADKTITITGTPTDYDELPLVGGGSSARSIYHLLPEGEYILSDGGVGRPATSALDSVYILVRRKKGADGLENTSIFSGAKNGWIRFTVDYSQYDYFRITLAVQPNYNIGSGVTIYPMIRRADIKDDTYEPYHESVETMYEEEIHGVNLFNDIKIETGKAWNGYTNANSARNIIPCEPNSEYIVSMNGTNGLDAVFFSVSASIPPVSQKAITSFPCMIKTGASDRYITLGFNKTNITLSDVTALKVMLRKADIDDHTYRPYNHQAIQNQLNTQGVLGAKNLLPNELEAKTVGGVTVTINDDSSVTLNGTATETLDSPLQLSSKINDILEVGKRYILTGCPANGGLNRYALVWRLNNASSTTLPDLDDGDGSEFTWQQYTGYVAIKIHIQSGYTCNNLTFKPMIRLASDPDDTYQPYAMTNRELTEIATKYTNPPTVIAKAAANKTWKAQMNTLYNAYKSLTNAQKLRCLLAINGFENGPLRNCGPNVANFSNTSMQSNGNMTIYTLRISEPVAGLATIKTDGTITYQDLTEKTNSSRLTLYLE